MLPLVEPLEVLQRATENPVNLNQGDTSSQHHHTASSPHIQLSPGNSVNGILCPNTFTLPGCAHILNSNTQAFGHHTQRQDLLPPYQQRKKTARTQTSPIDGQQHLNRAEACSTARVAGATVTAALKGPSDTHSTNLREIKDMLNLICTRLMY